MKKKILVNLLLLALVLTSVGSIKVTAAEKYATKIDVTSSKYGAKKNADSTGAIQKALDDAAKSAGKKRSLVTIPEGTYFITKSLRIGSNTHLKLSPKTIIKKTSNECLYMLRSNPTGKGKYNSISNVTIEGGTFDADFVKYNENSGGTLLFFSHANDIEIKNVTLKNNLGTHLIELAGAKNVKITGCEFYGFKYGSQKQAKEAIQLDITHDDTITPDAGPYDDTPCANITIKNNKIHDYPRAIGSHSSVKGIYHDNILVENNEICDISETAIYAYNYTNLTVKDNTINNVGAGISLKTFAKSAPHTLYERNKGVKACKLKNNDFNLIISNNTINTKSSKDDSESGGMGIFIYATEEYPISGCKITNNKINTPSSSIYLRFISNVEIDKNELSRPDNAIATSKTTFAEDAIKLLTTSSCKITNNTISESGKAFENAIALRDLSIDNTISNNQIYEPEKIGIALYDSSKATIESNEIHKPGKHGITALNDCTLDIMNNLIEFSKENGITVQASSTVYINGNTICGSKKNGISVTKDSTVSITQNVIEENDGIGILLSDSTVKEVSKNAILGNKSKGISLQRIKDGIITDNKLSNPKAKWEVTLLNCKLPKNENLYTFQDVVVKKGNNFVSGIANKGTTVYVSVNDKEFKVESTKRNFQVPVDKLKAGDIVVVYFKDKSENTVYSSFKLD